MTTLLTFYVLLVGVSIFFISKFKAQAFEATQSRNNYRKWLDESEVSNFDLQDQLRVAYKVIDRMQDKIDGTSFAEECERSIDAVPFVQHAGSYFDGEGMPQLDRMDWSSQDGVIYSESDDTDV